MKKGKVNIYGAIYDWNDNSAAAFIDRFNKALADNDEIELHLHCYGGEVIEGNLIYNAIKASKKPVDIYIDGLAASMGSIIAMAARKVYMAENAFMMIHAPSGYVAGTATEMERSANLLRSMERNFVKVLSKRTGKTDTEVAKWLDGDNWFDANEALAEKLIDGIVDAAQVEIIPENSDVKNISTAALYKMVATVSDKEIIKHNFKKLKQMDKESLIKKFGLTGVTAESSDDEVLSAIETKINEPKAQLAEEKTRQIKAAVDSAITAKKAGEKQRAILESVGEKQGIEALNTLIATMHPAQSITERMQPSGKSNIATARENWTWNDWQEKDPRGLERLRTEDEETFAALYKAEYGVSIC